MRLDRRPGGAPVVLALPRGDLVRNGPGDLHVRARHLSGGVRGQAFGGHQPDDVRPAVGAVGPNRPPAGARADGRAVEQSEAGIDGHGLRAVDQGAPAAARVPRDVDRSPGEVRLNAHGAGARERRGQVDDRVVALRVRPVDLRTLRDFAAMGRGARRVPERRGPAAEGRRHVDVRRRAEAGLVHDVGRGQHLVRRDQDAGPLEYVGADLVGDAHHRVVGVGGRVTVCAAVACPAAPEACPDAYSAAAPSGRPGGPVQTCCRYGMKPYKQGQAKPWSHAWPDGGQRAGVDKTG